MQATRLRMGLSTWKSSPVTFGINQNLSKLLPILVLIQKILQNVFPTRLRQAWSSPHIPRSWPDHGQNMSNAYPKAVQHTSEKCPKNMCFLNLKFKNRGKGVSTNGPFTTERPKAPPRVHKPWLATCFFH